MIVEVLVINAVAVSEMVDEGKLVVMITEVESKEETVVAVNWVAVVVVVVLSVIKRLDVVKVVVSPSTVVLNVLDDVEVT